MKQILNDRSFQLSIILTFIFFGTGITFLFLGLAAVATKEQCSPGKCKAIEIKYL